MSKIVMDGRPMAKSELPRVEEPVPDDWEKDRQFAIQLGNHGRGEFKEEECEYIDESEYPRAGSDPGLVVIFNHEKFRGKYPPRHGTRKDVEELIITLGRLKYNIDERFIYNDLTINQIKHEIDTICEMDLSKMNSLICVFLSHGDEHNMLAVYDGVIQAEEVYKPFAECKTLEGKPKLFIFQACKASNADQVDNENKTKRLISKRTIEIEIPKDFLLVYSTLEGEVSFRHTDFGTWFIQELCRNLTAYGRRDDVFSLIMRTTKCVSYNYYHETASFSREDNCYMVQKHKQMPIFISTLSKKFYLTKSIDRILLLHVLKNNDNLSKRIEALNARVTELSALLESK